MVVGWGGGVGGAWVHVNEPWYQWLERGLTLYAFITWIYRFFLF